MNQLNHKKASRYEASRFTIDRITEKGSDDPADVLAKVFYDLSNNGQLYPSTELQLVNMLVRLNRLDNKYRSNALQTFAYRREDLHRG